MSTVKLISGSIATAVLLPLLLAASARVRASSSDYTLTEITPLDGVPTDTSATTVDWSADGEWIAYAHLELSDSRWDVYRIRPDGTDNECLTCNHPGLPNGQQGNPTYHPSGRWLVFQAEKASHDDCLGGEIPGGGCYNDLWVMDLENQTQNPGYYDVYQLTDVRSGRPVGGSLYSHFSHDGTKLLWGDLEGGHICFGDWRLAVAGFVPSPTPHLENHAYYEPGDQKYLYEAQSWALDDSGFYFACAPLTGQDDRAIDMCYMDLATQELTRLTQSSGLNEEPDEFVEMGELSPLGNVFAWMTSAEHPINYSSCNHVQWLKAELWLMNLDGSGKTKLTHFNDPGYPEYDPGGVIVSNMSWNPDGTELAATVYYRGPNKSYIKIFHFSHAPRSVGGVAESPSAQPEAAADEPESSPPPVAWVGAVLGGTFALAAGMWYAWTRWRPRVT